MKHAARSHISQWWGETCCCGLNYSLSKYHSNHHAKTGGEKPPATSEMPLFPRPHRRRQQNAAKTLHAAQRRTSSAVTSSNFHKNKCQLKCFEALFSSFHFIIKWVMVVISTSMWWIRSKLKPLLHQMPSKVIIKQSPDNKKCPPAPITACQAFTIISFSLLNKSEDFSHHNSWGVYHSWPSFIDP